MTTQRGADLLYRFIEGGDAEADELVRAAVAAWLAHGPDSPAGLLARLGLPGTRPGTLRAMRDYHLLAAAKEITDTQLVTLDRPGQLYRALAEACRLFGRSWPVWRRLPGPPPAANNLERLLYRAFAASDAAGGTRNGLPHGPGEWGLSAFRKLLDLHEIAPVSARRAGDSGHGTPAITRGHQHVETVT